jgi:hypothetical protein
MAGSAAVLWAEQGRYWYWTPRPMPRWPCSPFTTGPNSRLELRRAANAYLAEVETSINRGTYISLDAGRIRLGDYATRWPAAATMNAPPTSTLPG